MGFTSQSEWQKIFNFFHDILIHWDVAGESHQELKEQVGWVHIRDSMKYLLVWLFCSFCSFSLSSPPLLPLLCLLCCRPHQPGSHFPYLWFTSEERLMGGFSIPANGGAVMIRVYLVEGELGGGWGWWMLGGRWGCCENLLQWWQKDTFSASKKTVIVCFPHSPVTSTFEQKRKTRSHLLAIGIYVSKVHHKQQQKIPKCPCLISSRCCDSQSAVPP